MASPRFLSEFEPRYGECVQVARGVQRVVARNPSKFTAWGTGTYLVGDDQLAVVDPGPDDAAHIGALMAAIGERTVTHILVTHTHADHSPATAAIKDATGAPSYGFGPHPLDADQLAEEHGDLDFVPDVTVGDGEVIIGRGFTFECLHTPGHISNHLCFAERSRGCLFSGDHVMGWSTTVISPPAGDVADYLASLRRLSTRDERVYYPTHGPPIADPRRFVAELIDHRLHREAQILERLAVAPATVDELVAGMYAEVRAELHEPAARSVTAHLLALERDRRVRPDADGRWELIG